MIYDLMIYDFKTDPHMYTNIWANPGYLSNLLYHIRAKEGFLAWIC